MSWAATAVGVVGAIGGGLLGSSGAKKAAKEQAKATQAAIDEQRREFDLSRSDTAPYRAIGSQALNALGRIYGYDANYNQVPAGSGVTIDNATGQVIGGNAFAPTPGGGVEPRLTNGPSNGVSTNPVTGLPDYSAFYMSPDYQFRKDQGMQGIERSLAARGLAKSGNALTALNEYNSNLAAGEFGNYFNRQTALAGIGQSAVNTSTNAGTAAAGNIGNALIAGGNARASGVAGQYDALGNMLADLGTVAGNYFARRDPYPQLQPVRTSVRRIGG